MVKIIPFDDKKISRKEAVNTLRKMRKHYNGKPGDFNVREAIGYGRKH